MHVQFKTPDISELRKEYMLVDMHFHSRYSHDSSTSIPQIIERARQLGVSVALTDHNCIKGVLAAQKIAPGVVKPGVELTTKEGNDILAYFYEVSELEAFFNTRVRPYIRKKSSLRSGKMTLRTADLLEDLSKRNCVIALAHPFAVGPRRCYPFFRNNGRNHLLRYVHAMEVVNQAIPHKRNLSAIGWAAQCDKAIIGGSDGHIPRMLGTAFTLSKAASWKEFLDNIKKKKVSAIGEEKKLHHHVMNMARVLREKARVLQNRRIRKE